MRQSIKAGSINFVKSVAALSSEGWLLLCVTLIEIDVKCANWADSWVVPVGQMKGFLEFRSALAALAAKPNV